MNNNVFGMGQYAYPFFFVLPPNLPGSFEFYDFETRCCVKYIVTAKALSWLENIRDISHKNLLIVRQPLKFFQYPTNLSDTKNITTWCCFSQGTATINVSYPKNFFCQNEAVQVLCELNNTRCKLNASCIKLQLIQQITLRFQYGARYFSRIVAQCRDEAQYVIFLIIILINS
jgi:hypothetical protein